MLPAPCCCRRHESLQALWRHAPLDKHHVRNLPFLRISQDAVNEFGDLGQCGINLYISLYFRDSYEQHSIQSNGLGSSWYLSPHVTNRILSGYFWLFVARLLMATCGTIVIRYCESSSGFLETRSA